MSWDADLVDDRCQRNEGCWNFTHNTNGMANTVLRESWDQIDLVAREILWWLRRDRPDVAEQVSLEGRWTWWTALDRRSGPEGAAFLDHIIRKLQADPDRFRAMNPENGWGDYDSFVEVLIEMRNAVPEWPTHWHVSG